LPDFDVPELAGKPFAEFGGLGLPIGVSVGEEDSGHQVGSREFGDSSKKAPEDSPGWPALPKAPVGR